MDRLNRSSIDRRRQDREKLLAFLGMREGLGRAGVLYTW